VRLFLGGKKESRMEEEKIKGCIEVMAMRLGKINWRIMYLEC
jgi:hypothetical protein